MGKHSAAEPPQRPAGVVVVVALVLGLALAGGLYFLLRQTDDNPGLCGSSFGRIERPPRARPPPPPTPSETVRVAAAPA